MDKKGGCSIAGSPFIGIDTVSVLVLDDGDKKTEDLTARAEILAGYTAIEELDQDVRQQSGDAAATLRRQQAIRQRKAAAHCTCLTAATWMTRAICTSRTAA